MGKSLDELRAEAAVLQGVEPSRKKSKSKSTSASPELEEWEKQIVEIENRPKKVKLHQWHNRIVERINAGDEVSDIMERFDVTTKTIKSTMKIHSQQTDKNNDKTI